MIRKILDEIAESNRLPGMDKRAASMEAIGLSIAESLEKIAATLEKIERNGLETFPCNGDR